MIRATAGLLILLVALLTGCVTEPPSQEFVNDLQNDFENEDYFNP